MPMNMLFAHSSFENPDVFGITDLNNEFSASLLSLSFEDVVAILRHPDNMNYQSGNRVSTVLILYHMLLAQAYRREQQRLKSRTESA